jgi:hypothetical protein
LIQEHFSDAVGRASLISASKSQGERIDRMEQDDPEDSGSHESEQFTSPNRRKFAEPRRSIRASGTTNLIDPEQVEFLQKLGHDEIQETYNEVIAEARRCIGHGATLGAFPEEWDAQLLIDAGRTADGYRLVVFTPAFLTVMLQDERELDRAFKYILLMLDGIVSENKYVFVYCHAGMDWSHPFLTHRLRVAYDMLPPVYGKNLKRLYVVHPTVGFKALMLTFWPFMSSSLWKKMQYVDSLDELCEKLQKSSSAHKALRRRFPQLVQREDCLHRGMPPPTTFGVPLKRLCDGFGVDFTDKTTGRWYPRLPPALVFICEALERQAADESFGKMFTSEAAVMYDLVATIDGGEPLDPECSLPALWCCLKLFVDCLPKPLLGHEAFQSLPSKVQTGDKEAQIKFLARLLHQELDADSAYMALYLVSFLNTMCESAKQRLASRTNLTVNLGSSSEGLVMDEISPPLTEELASEVFASGFLRPRDTSKASKELTRAARSLVKTFIEHADDKSIWIGADADEVKENAKSESGSGSEESDA